MLQDRRQTISGRQASIYDDPKWEDGGARYLTHFAQRFSEMDDAAAREARGGGVEAGGRSREGSGFRNYRDRKDSMRRGQAVRATQRAAAKAAA